MTETLAERVVSTFELTPEQMAAALERKRDVVVTAGAGSGKTRTLVARYAGLLADGLSPRRVVAITFTKKAAREMRSRVRKALGKLAQRSANQDERQRWIALGNQMDSAQIGTIHSLCSEILRTHPADASIDPRFEVLDEGLTAVLRSQVVGDVTTLLVEQPEFSKLFEEFNTSGVEKLLKFLLDQRLDASEIFSRKFEGRAVIQKELESILAQPALAEPIFELNSSPYASLLRSEGDKLADMVAALLVLWKQAQTALAAGDVFGCAANLFQARREKMSGTIGKRGSTVKETVKAIKQAYDQLLDPLIGGAEKGQPPSRETEARFDELHALIQKAFEILLQTYQSTLQKRQSLDFDDLEQGAFELLQQPAIRARWQAEVDAVLVDEFQDTNLRQRQIVEALAGTAGRLFLVGDARQSIYRFRRADVSVFRAIQKRIKAQGGLVLDLDITYRAHESLMLATGDLLASVMGTQEDAARPYYVPFTALKANRKSAPDHLRSPHIEFVLGVGDEIKTAREAAAQALAGRLTELKEEGQIQKWDEVALLFRASTGFQDYEDAFENADIPFLTVAGRGFYERPEIRDAVNILRALADPQDDVAMAGLLRSPAVGVSDAGLYLLRWQNERAISFREALAGDLSHLDEQDLACSLRARRLLDSLLPQVDRIPVAELIKKLVDETDYRAILAADDTRGGGGRLWRNLDKLLEDAYSSQQINVRDFLEYLQTIDAAGAREGEAPAEAQGAVRLMTIHKSKGLEFPVVVLADAGRDPRGKSETAYLSPELGFSFKLRAERGTPLLYRTAKNQEQQRDEAETLRMLYVALTRAKDKLLISGHAAPPRTDGEIGVSAWMEDLMEASGIELASLLAEPGLPHETSLASGQPVRAWCAALETSPQGGLDADKVNKSPDSELLPLYTALPEAAAAFPKVDDMESTHKFSMESTHKFNNEATRFWRATSTGTHVPASVIGEMVHKAIELWLFPDNPRLIPMLETTALNAGLTSKEQQTAAVRKARELLERFRQHPLWDEIDSSPEIHHEVPYSLESGGQIENGYIDLLYRTADGWKVVDFKTDAIYNRTERENLVRMYSQQLQRYSSAVQKLLGQPTVTSICFLDDENRVGIISVDRVI